MIVRAYRAGQDAASRTGGAYLKFGVQSSLEASCLAALEILAIALPLLWFPPCQTGASSDFVLPQLQLHATRQDRQRQPSRDT